MDAETRAKAEDAHAERAAAATRGRKAKGADGGRVAEREEARAEMRTRPPTLEHDRDSREAAMVVIIARQACGRAPDPIRTPTRNSVRLGTGSQLTATQLKIIMLSSAIP